MTPIRKLTVICTAFALLLSGPVFQIADNGAGRLAAQPVNAEDRRQAARDLISQFLLLSRSPEIYQDLQRSVRQVMLPILNDMLSGDWPNQAAMHDPLAREAIGKLRNFFDHLLRASAEIQGALAENRDELISDIANLMARHMTLVQINDAKKLLSMPAMRKLFDTIYAISQLHTNFTYEDAHKLAQLTAWMEELDLNDAVTAAPSEGTDFSPEKMALAQNAVSELLRVSRLDDMVADIRRLLEEIAKAAPAIDANAKITHELIAQLMAGYEMQKAVLIAAAPYMLASALTEEQLLKFQILVRSPVMAKSFRLLDDAVRNATSFTAEDILSLQDFAEDLKQRGLSGESRSIDQQRAFERETDALIEKWREILLAGIAPETLDGLQRSFRDLQGLREKIDIEDNGPGRTQL